MNDGNGNGKAWKTKNDLQGDCEKMAMDCHAAWLVLGQIHELASGMAEAMEGSLLLPVLKNHKEMYENIARMTDKWKGYKSPRDLMTQES